MSPLLLARRKGLAALIPLSGLQGTPDMIAGERPAGGPRLEGAVGEAIGPARSDDLHVIDQALTLAQKREMQAVRGNATAPRARRPATAGPVVQDAGELHGRPLGAARLVAVGPIGREHRVPAGVNELQGTASFV